MMTHELLSPGNPAPVLLVVFLGALVTPTVLLGFTILHSVWLTYISLYYLWVVAPALVCYCWRASRQRVVSAWRRGFRRARLQAAIALPALPTVRSVVLILRPLGDSPPARLATAAGRALTQRATHTHREPMVLSSAGIGLDASLCGVGPSGPAA